MHSHLFSKARWIQNAVHQTWELILHRVRMFNYFVCLACSTKSSGRSRAVSLLRQRKKNKLNGISNRCCVLSAAEAETEQVYRLNKLSHTLVVSGNFTPFGNISVWVICCRHCHTCFSIRNDELGSLLFSWQLPQNKSKEKLLLSPGGKSLINFVPDTLFSLPPNFVHRCQS